MLFVNLDDENGRGDNVKKGLFFLLKLMFSIVNKMLKCNVKLFILFCLIFGIDKWVVKVCG